MEIKRINSNFFQKLPANKEEISPEPKDTVSLSTQKEWTVLFYLNGNSDLSSISVNKLRDLEKSGSDENLNLVAQIARKKRPVQDFISGDWSGARRYYVTGNPSSPGESYKEFHSLDPMAKASRFGKMMKNALQAGKEKGQTSDSVIDNVKFLHKAIKSSPYDSISHILSDTGEIHSECLSDEGKISMSEPESLKDFLQWGIKKYPAKHYMVVIQGHGEGADGVLADKDGKMSLPELSSVLKDTETETGVKPDILAFDACLMGASEVAYQLKDRADIMVASEEIERGFAMPLDRIFSSFKENLKSKDISPQKLAMDMVDACRNNYKENFTPTMAAIDLKEMGEFGKYLDEFSLNLIKANIPDNIILPIIAGTQHYGASQSVSRASNFMDLYHFASRLLENKDIQDKKLKDSASGLMNNLSRIVLNSSTTGKEYADSHGLSILLPAYSTGKLENKVKEYKKLDISKDTNWDEFISQRADKLT